MLRNLIEVLITIKGDTLIKKGTGSKTNPYSIGDFKVAQSNDKLNTRYTGEYIEYSNYLWRIIEVKDGRTKVILADTISSDQEWVETSYESKTQIYNPKEKGNV